jgi:hypothetical protein
MELTKKLEALDFYCPLWAHFVATITFYAFGIINNRLAVNNLYYMLRAALGAFATAYTDIIDNRGSWGQQFVDWFSNECRKFFRKVE